MAATHRVAIIIDPSKIADALGRQPDFVDISSFFDISPAWSNFRSCSAALRSASRRSPTPADGLERVFKSRADRHRVRILNRLLQAGDEAVCVCDFEAMLGLKQPTVSYHLKQLLDAGLVSREKRGSYAWRNHVGPARIPRELRPPRR
jgi:DNA-binding transcriptional ArsR family regulator